MFTEVGTKFAFLSKPKGASDLRTKGVAELKEMLDRQNNLLANKFLINKLSDKGAKIQKIRDQLIAELRCRENTDDAERIGKNSTVWEWKDKSNPSTGHKSNNVEPADNAVLRLLSETGQIPSVSHKKSHMQRLIDKEKDPNFTYKPYNPVVADKVKKVIPDAHTEHKGPISVKPLHLEESLELLSEQMSALKILSKTARRRIVDECIEDRLNESTGEIEEELDEVTAEEA